MGDIFKGGVLFDNSKQTGNGKINFVPGFLDKNKEEPKKETTIYQPEEEKKEIESILKEFRRMRRKNKKLRKGV